MEKIAGKALLLKLKNSNGVSRRELAKDCGYYSTNKEGKIRVNLMAFYEAVAEAKGLNLNPESKSDRRGRELTYTTAVQKGGHIHIGTPYIEAMGLKPGDAFEIHLGYKHIKLIKIELAELQAA